MDTQTKEDLAVLYGTKATHAAAFTADPGALGTTTPASEVTGGTYARKALTWAAGGVDGQVTASATFDIPANVAVAYVGTMSGSGAGARLIDKVAAVYNSQPQAGQVTVNFTFTES